LVHRTDLQSSALEIWHQFFADGGIVIHD
jgi:hypothetical protein